MTLAPGDVLAGRFRVEELLGRGGYGEVYRALQLSVDREVAIKVLRVTDQDPHELAVRFRREAQLLSRLRHPNVVQVLDFGDADGVLFLAMEFVRGPTLKERPVTQPAIAEVRTLLHGVASALAAAHDLGMVHRDLKPANIILADGRFDRPVVIDFGLAKVYSADGGGEELTRASVMLGTPAYMSPEVVIGDPVDARTDLYSLGVIAFELLAGQKPFRGGSALETATARLANAAPELQSLRADVPRGLANLVGALLAREPGARPASAAEVCVRLLEPDRLSDEPPELVSTTIASNRRSPQSLAASRASNEPAPARDTPPLRGRTAAAVGLALATALVVWRVSGGPDATPAPVPDTLQAAAIEASAPPMVESEAAAAGPTVATSVEGAGGTAPPPDAVPAATVPGPPNGDGTAIVTSASAAAPSASAAAASSGESPERESPSGRPSSTTSSRSESAERATRQVEAERPAEVRQTPPAQNAATGPAGPMGILQINIDPFGTARAGGKTCNSPCRLDLPAGRHSVVLTYGAQSATKTVDLEAGQTVRVSEAFPPEP